jgi:hypothetical protein
MTTFDGHEIGEPSNCNGFDSVFVPKNCFGQILDSDIIRGELVCSPVTTGLEAPAAVQQSVV